MNRISITIVVLIIVFLSIFTACSKKDKVVYVGSNDPEMEAAIEKARKSLPQFWEIFEKRENGERNFSLKVRITDNKGTEYFWTVGIERRDGKIMVSIDNDPNIVKSVKIGDRIEIPESDIADWLYVRDGKMVGNETLRPLLKKMPADEAEKLKKMMANP